MGPVFTLGDVIPDGYLSTWSPADAWHSVGELLSVHSEVLRLQLSLLRSHARTFCPDAIGYRCAGANGNATAPVIDKGRQMISKSMSTGTAVLLVSLMTNGAMAQSNTPTLTDSPECDDCCRRRIIFAALAMPNQWSNQPP